MFAVALSLQTFKTLSDSFGASFADAINHLQSSARDELLEVVERRDFELLVKRRGGLEADAADAQEVERAFRRFGSQLFPCVECAFVEQLDNLTTDCFAHAGKCL